MTDKEKWLRVARIMWPDREWAECRITGGVCTLPMPNHIDDIEQLNWMTFDHITDAAGFQMARWLARRVKTLSVLDAGEAIVNIQLALQSDNPNEALADMVIEMGEK